MKIAVLAHSFPRFPGDTHGPFVKRLSEEMARLGHDVHVLVPYDEEIAPAPESPLTMHHFRYVKPDGLHLLGYSRTLKGDVGMRLGAWLQSPLYFFFGERALRRLVRQKGIDLIHAHWILPNGYIASRVSEATGVPCAVTLHGSDVFMAERNSLFTRMARQALDRASYVTSCSGPLRQRLVALAENGDDDPGDKVHLVPNGTDVTPVDDNGDRGRAVRERHGIAPETPVLAAVGRLVHKKGFDVLLDAMPKILEERPEARLLLGGGGDLENDLRAQARRLELGDAVIFTGSLTHPEVLELLTAADVFVMPSVRDAEGNVDGLPIVVLEAMAAGLPVVASDVSGIPLAVEPGETGLLVPEKDREALARGVVELLDDPDRARRLGQAGRRRVADELNWTAVAEIHDRLARAAVEEMEAIS